MGDTAHILPCGGEKGIEIKNIAVAKRLAAEWSG
jgi:putative component of toxin-antitoxin plasmid stabilization module